jgi:hypothetical protein
MNDGKSNGVDIRWRRGSFKYDSGNYSVFWQLRNRYSKDVRISFKLNFKDADGSSRQTSEVVRVNADETTGSGYYSISYELDSYQSVKIEFLQ